MRLAGLTMALLLAGVAGTVTADSPYEPSPTELAALERGEILVRLREVPGSAIKEGKALGLIDAAPERVFQVVTDLEAFPEFMPHVRQSTVEPQADGSLVNYQYLDLPFPIRDRYYKIRVVHRVEETHRGRVWRSSWTYLPGSGNVVENYGAWTLRDYGGRTLALYQVFTDPGGWIPAWAANRASRQTLPDILRALRRRSESR